MLRLHFLIVLTVAVITVLADSSEYRYVQHNVTFPALHPMFNYTNEWIPQLPPSEFEMEKGSMITNRTGAGVSFTWEGPGLQVDATGPVQAKWTSWEWKGSSMDENATRTGIKDLTFTQQDGKLGYRTIHLQLTSLGDNGQVELRSITLSFTVKTKA